MNKKKSWNAIFASIVINAEFVHRFTAPTLFFTASNSEPVHFVASKPLNMLSPTKNIHQKQTYDSKKQIFAKEICG